ncbi:MAG: hypothetical protein ACOYUZ_04405 [Patescibacteria group bacterium]
MEKRGIKPKLKQKTEQSGDLISSLFPKTRALLENDPVKNDLVLNLEGARALCEYRSITDYLLCAIFPNLRRFCLAYYRHGKPPLTEFLLPGETDILDEAMVFAIEALFDSSQRGRRMNARQLRMYLQKSSGK